MSTLLRHIVSRSITSRRKIVSMRYLSSSTMRRKDPWPIPHTPEHIASTASPTDLPPPEPLPRPGESLERMRARLVYQSRKRGTLESDLLLSTFAQEHLSDMNVEELSEFDKVCATISFIFFLIRRGGSHLKFVLAHGRTGLGYILLGNGETDAA
jgi:succinate dehydrogenase assembly factor 2